MRDEPLGEWIVHKLNRIDERTEIIMASISDLVTEDAALADEVNQVLALVQEDSALIAQLQGAIGSGNLDPQQQTDVDNLFAQLTAQHDKIAAALNPPAPAPAPADPTTGANAPVDTTAAPEVPETPAPVDGEAVNG